MRTRLGWFYRVNETGKSRTRKRFWSTRLTSNKTFATISRICEATATIDNANEALLSSAAMERKCKVMERCGRFVEDKSMFLCVCFQWVTVLVTGWWTLPPWYVWPGDGEQYRNSTNVKFQRHTWAGKSIDVRGYIAFLLVPSRLINFILSYLLTIVIHLVILLK